MHFKRKLFLPPLIALNLFFSTACNQGVGGAPAFLEKSPEERSTEALNGSSDRFEGFKNPKSIQKLIYHVGPVNLKAGQTAEEMSDKPVSLNFQVSEPLWITSFKPSVIDENGNRLSGQILHKAIIFNKNEANPVCNAGNFGNPFAAATSTLTKVELPEGYGYPLLPSDPLVARAVFQNFTEEDYVGVLFSFELEAISMEKAKGYVDVKAVFLDTDPCEHKPLQIEPGAFVEKSKTFTMPEGGGLMVANGVLSNYGVSISLIHQAEGTLSLIPFWRTQALLDESHQIVDLTDNPFFDPVGKTIHRGDKLTLGVAFDNFSEKWHNEATGAAMLYITPEE